MAPSFFYWLRCFNDIYIIHAILPTYFVLFLRLTALCNVLLIFPYYFSFCIACLHYSILGTTVVDVFAYCFDSLGWLHNSMLIFDLSYCMHSILINIISHTIDCSYYHADGCYLQLAKLCVAIMRLVSNHFCFE